MAGDNDGKLFLALLLVAIAIPLFSDPAEAITESEFDQAVAGMVRENMTASNFTYYDNLYFLTYKLMRLERFVKYPQEYYPLDRDPLIARIDSNQNIIVNTLNTVELLSDQLEVVKTQLAQQQALTAQLSSQLNSMQQSQSSSLVSTLGTAFKTLGETLLAMAQESPSQGTTPIVQPPATTTQPPESAPPPSTAPVPVGTPGLISVNAGQVSINRASESGHAIENALDNNAVTYFAKSYNSLYPVSLIVDFGQPVVLTTVRIVSRAGLSDDLIPSSLEFYSSSTGNEFNYRGVRRLSKATAGTYTEVQGLQDASRYYKLTFPEKTNGDPNQLQFAEIKFYGYAQ